MLADLMAELRKLKWHLRHIKKALKGHLYWNRSSNFLKKGDKN